MESSQIQIRVAQPSELPDVGNLMITVYSQLEGFPSRQEQPSYYEQFNNLPSLTKAGDTQVIVAITNGIIVGAIIFYPDVKHYGAGGEATTSLANTAAIRLLAVSVGAKGKGIGRMLTEHCIAKAQAAKCSQLILHTTEFMPTALSLYEKFGFERFPDIDFMQENLEVFGFQLSI